MNRASCFVLFFTCLLPSVGISQETPTNPMGESLEPIRKPNTPIPSPRRRGEGSQFSDGFLVNELRVYFSTNRTLSDHNARELVLSDINNSDGRIELVHKGQLFATDGILNRNDVNEEYAWAQPPFGIGGSPPQFVVTEKFTLADNLHERRLNADVLIAAHQGADNGTSADTIDAVALRFVVFAAGEGHDHPRWTMRRLIDNGATSFLFRTNLGDSPFGKS